MVGVTLGVTDILGVALGEILILGVILGVALTDGVALGVGVILTAGLSTIIPISNSQSGSVTFTVIVAILLCKLPQ